MTKSLYKVPGYWMSATDKKTLNRIMMLILILSIILPKGIGTCVA